MTFVLILRASNLSSDNAPSRKYATMGIRQSSVSIATAMVNSNSILGFSTYPTGIVHRAFCSNIKPRLAKASTWVFELRRTCSMLHSSNWALRDCTTGRYDSIRGSFAVYSPNTWFTMSCESLWTFSLWAPSALANQSPAIRASYSVLLLEALNLNRNDCSMTSLVDNFKYTPMPEPFMFDAPLTISVHGYSSSSLVCGISWVNLVMK